MFKYDYHCLIDNKRLRTRLLFHLYLEYNTSHQYTHGQKFQIPFDTFHFMMFALLTLLGRIKLRTVLIILNLQIFCWGGL